ncbi:MAG: hypothetical protein GC162_04680 [Planctomycetes bacterium]|nr:hypothetical protein [Planctomycetota bacterium]
MKYPLNLTLAAVLAAAFATQVPAATQTWNTAGPTNTWNLTDTNWDAGAAWTNGNDALFAGSGEAVTVAAVTANGLSFTDNGYSLTGGTLTLGGAGPSINVDPAFSATIASTIAGTAGLAKAGAGTLTLTNNSNSYTGTTTVNAGKLVLQSNAATLASTSFTVNNGGTLRFDFSSVGGGAGFTNMNTKASTINAGGTLELFTSNHTAGPNSAGIITSTGSSFAGAGNLNKEGAGNIIINNVGALNSFTGTMNINAGTLTLQGASTSTTGTYTVNVGASGAFDIRTESKTMGALDGSGSVTKSSTLNGASTLTVGNGGASGAFSGTIANPTGIINLAKTGAGTQTLSGTNTYTGTTTISDGTLQLGSGGTTGALTGTSSITNNANLTINRSNAFTQATDLNNKVISGSGSLTKTGSGTATLSLTNTYTGITTVNQGVLAVTGSLANNNFDKIKIAADADGSFATTDAKLTRARASGASYVNFGSAITSSQLTSATILSGSNTTGSTLTMGMEWRTLASTVGQGNAKEKDLISDVLNLTGIDNTKFVLQMSYTDFINDALDAAQGSLFLAYLDTGTSTWKNAVAGNHGANTGSFRGNTAWNATFSNLGDWGADAANNVVWAVVDHNSQFAAMVPTPLALPAGLGLLGLLTARRRNRQ